MTGIMAAHEVEIIWEEDISRLRYVRERVEICTTRCHSIPYHGSGRRVGYSVLGPDAPSSFKGKRLFYRRLFFLAYDDEGVDGKADGPYGLDDCPYEAIDPLSVVPGKDGEQNARAWGGKLPFGDPDDSPWHRRQKRGAGW